MRGHAVELSGSQYTPSLPLLRDDGLRELCDRARLRLAGFQNVGTFTINHMSCGRSEGDRTFLYRGVLSAAKKTQEGVIGVHTAYKTSHTIDTLRSAPGH